MTKSELIQIIIKINSVEPDECNYDDEDCFSSDPATSEAIYNLFNIFDPGHTISHNIDNMTFQKWDGERFLPGKIIHEHVAAVIPEEIPDSADLFTINRLWMATA